MMRSGYRITQIPLVQFQVHPILTIRPLTLTLLWPMISTALTDVKLNHTHTLKTLLWLLCNCREVLSDPLLCHQCLCMAWSSCKAWD